MIFAPTAEALAQGIIKPKPTILNYDKPEFTILNYDKVDK